MNDTQIKTRHGLILQGVTGEALNTAGFSFEADVQYDSTCEKPDFLIPDAISPRIMIEVHQTDVRNSLAMKILRAFTAVMECKAHYGPELVTINLIFGVPDQDFSSSPMSALGAIYDISYLPSQDKLADEAMAVIEQDSFEYAGNEDVTTEKAIVEICKQRPAEIKLFGKALRRVIDKAQIRSELLPLWCMERERQSNLGEPPPAGLATYHKRMMLAAMFFSDNEFDQLMEGVTKDVWAGSCVRQLSRVGLGEIVEEIYGDEIKVSPDFEMFLRQHNTQKLRKLCESALAKVPDMHWYFEDIRNLSRRLKMADCFLSSLKKGREAFLRDLALNVLEGSFEGIEHTRTWYADFVSLYCNLGFNALNRLIYQDPRYPLTLWSPFNNLALKWSAHERNRDYVNIISRIISDVVYEKVGSLKANEENMRSRLAEDLLDFRLRSSVKLRRFNPLVIITEAICENLRLIIKRMQIETLLSDLAANSRVGQMLVFSISDPNTGKKIMASIVAVKDKNGDHKSKEWGARRLSTLYRIVDGKICQPEHQDSIFIIDGDWTDKDVARLHRSGWAHIVRPNEIENTLQDIFELSTGTTLTIPEEAPLPLAAEKEIPIQIKGKINTGRSKVQKAN